MKAFSKFATAAGAAIALGCAAMPAQAGQYLLTYTSTDSLSPFSALLNVFTLDVMNAVNGYDVTAIGGTVTSSAGVETVTGVTPNPNQPNQSTSLSGSFFFDNVLFFPATPYLSNAGLLFHSATREYNLFSDSPTQYELYRANPAVSFDFSEHSAGTLSVAAVPEPATWGLMILGFGGLGVMLRRARRQPAQAACA